MAKQVKHAGKSGGIYVGCSGWAYTSWKPGFYPATLPARKFLEYYGARLNSVEVNYTFRSLPTEKVIDSWLAAVGDGFRFSFKAPQRITHFSRLKDCSEALDEFVRSIARVKDAGRLGVVLFQLPPNMKADAELLANFLKPAASSGLRMAFEFRHESWFVDEVYALLRSNSTALCVAESDELSTPDVQTAPFSCYRLRRSVYKKRALDEVRARLRARAEQGEVFAYFKHEEEPTGALRAVAVRKGLST